MLAYTTPARGEVIPARRGVGCLFREWVFGDTSCKINRMFPTLFILNSFEGGQDDVTGMKIKCIICIVFLVFRWQQAVRYKRRTKRPGM